jgi:transposase
MSKRLFNSEQIEDLLRNPNVDNCSAKSIRYKQDFKVWAVKQYEEAGWSPKKIFAEAGFDLCLIGSRTPEWRIDRWANLKRNKGYESLTVDGRGKSTGGGRPKTKWSSDAERIKYLETKVAYLQAENDFLIKLRSGKTE